MNQEGVEIFTNHEGEKIDSKEGAITHLVKLFCFSSTPLVHDEAKLWVEKYPGLATGWVSVNESSARHIRSLFRHCCDYSLHYGDFYAQTTYLLELFILTRANTNDISHLYNLKRFDNHEIARFLFLACIVGLDELVLFFLRQEALLKFNFLLFSPVRSFDLDHDLGSLLASGASPLATETRIALFRFASLHCQSLDPPPPYPSKKWDWIRFINAALNSTGVEQRFFTYLVDSLPTGCQSSSSCIEWNSGFLGRFDFVPTGWGDVIAHLFSKAGNIRITCEKLPVTFLWLKAASSVRDLRTLHCRLNEEFFILHGRLSLVLLSDALSNLKLLVELDVELKSSEHRSAVASKMETLEDMIGDCVSTMPKLEILGLRGFSLSERLLVCLQHLKVKRVKGLTLGLWTDTENPISGQRFKRLCNWVRTMERLESFHLILNPPFPHLDIHDATIGLCQLLESSSIDTLKLKGLNVEFDHDVCVALGRNRALKNLTWPRSLQKAEQVLFGEVFERYCNRVLRDLLYFTGFQDTSFCCDDEKIKYWTALNRWGLGKICDITLEALVDSLSFDCSPLINVPFLGDDAITDDPDRTKFHYALLREDVAKWTPADKKSPTDNHDPTATMVIWMPHDDLDTTTIQQDRLRKIAKRRKRR